MSTAPYIQPNLKNLNCRVRLTEAEHEIFNIEICGTISATDGRDRAIAKISVIDITDGIRKAKPVYAFIEKRQIEYSHNFCYTANLGRLPGRVTTLSDWMAVAKIPAEWLVFPREGKRNLHFETSVISQQSGAELAYAECDFRYENQSLGYIEFEKNIRRAKTKAIPLALVVAATDKKISAHAVEIIRKWTANSIAVSNTSIAFNKLLAQTIALFPNGTRIYSNAICKKITDTVPFQVRCDILELCLRIAGTGGIVAFEQLVLLKNIADWFAIPRERFRAMFENILPVRMYEVKDLEISLGVTSDMNNDQLCRQLSKEYRKWNARVTNRNPEIENQAEQMLKLIAELRSQCTD